MLISKKNRLAILTHLFKEGVIVAKKDFNLPKHPDVEEVSNLEVIKLLTSLTSRDLVTCRFSWKHYYWFLTDAGIECAPPPLLQRVSGRGGGGISSSSSSAGSTRANRLATAGSRRRHGEGRRGFCPLGGRAAGRAIWVPASPCRSLCLHSRPPPLTAAAPPRPCRRYLREYLHLPEDMVPNTLKKSTRPAAPPGRGPPEGERRPPREGGGGFRGEREGYRSEGGAPRGFGRGGGAPRPPA